MTAEATPGKEPDFSYLKKLDGGSARVEPASPVAVGGSFEQSPRALDRRPSLNDNEPRPAWASGLQKPDGSIGERVDLVREARNKDLPKSSVAPKGAKIGERPIDRTRADVLTPAVSTAYKLPGAGSKRQTETRSGNGPQSVLDQKVGPVTDDRAVSDDDLSVEIEELRTESSKVYQNPDGTRTVTLYPAPINKSVNGKWELLDPTATAVADGFDADGGSFTSQFRPSGSKSAMVSLKLADGRMISYSMDGAKPTKPEARGSRVVWKNVDTQVDFQVEQLVGEIKAAVILHAQRAAGSFTFSVVLPSDVSIRATKEGGAELVGKDAKLLGSIPAPIAFDANGKPGQMTMLIGTSTSPGAPVKLTLAVAPEFLATATYPVQLDPSLAIGGGYLGGQNVGVHDAMIMSSPSGPGGNTGSNAGVAVYRNGWWQSVIAVGSWDFGAPYYRQISRGLFKWDLPAGLENQEITAAVFAPYITNGSTQNQGTLLVQPVTSPWNEAIVGWTSQPAVDPTLRMTKGIGTEGWGSSQVDVLPWVRRWQADPTNPANNNGFMVKVIDAVGAETLTAGVAEIEASETNGATYAALLSITYDPGTGVLPAAAVQTYPVSVADPAGRAKRVDSLTPTLTVNPVAGANVQYFFKVGSSPTLDGTLYTSGWISGTSHTIAPNVLRVGQVYWWKVFTRFSNQGGWRESVACTNSAIAPNSGCPGRFQVNPILADDGIGASDSHAGATVNLRTGNVTVGVGSKSVGSMSGSVGFGFTYNSQQPSNYGLRAEYFLGSASFEVQPGEKPVMVRTEPQMNFVGSGSPGGEVPGENFRVRWTGKMRVPQTGNYTFSAASDDFIRVRIGTTDVVWFGLGNSTGSPIPLTNTQLYDFYGASLNFGGPYTTVLYYSLNGSAPQVVPADWFFTGAEVVPPGWTMTGAAGVAYSGLKIEAGEAILYDSSGNAHAFPSVDQNTYSSPPGEEGLVLARNTDGTYTLHADETTILFNADGTIKSVRTAQDLLQPSTLRYEYGGNPSRLWAVVDPVSGKKVQLQYGGDPNPNAGGGCGTSPHSGAAAPIGQICRVNWWDGTETWVHYYANSQLHMVVNPGSEFTSFEYDGNGRMATIWNTYTNDQWISQTGSYGSAFNKTYISYSGAGVASRAATVTSPKPSASGSEIVHTYYYNSPTNSTMTATGIAGNALIVNFDSDGRKDWVRDAAGLQTNFTWDAAATARGKDRLVAVTDPGGRKATTVYDNLGRPTDGYGPAPQAMFGADQRPTAANASSVPHSSTTYDGGYQGLAVSYWNDPNDNVHHTGAPVKIGLETGTGGEFYRVWGPGSPAAGVNADNWSGRYTGSIAFPQNGTYRLWVVQDNGMRVWIDDQLVIDSYAQILGQSNPVDYTNVDGPGALHRIRIDHYELNADAQMGLFVIPPGGSGQWVPSSWLSPSYDLVTSSVTDDSTQGSPASRVDTAYGGEPWLRLPQSTTVNPGGLALATTYTYDAGNRNRLAARTLPGGTVWNYEYWPDSGASPGICSQSTADQMGRLRIKRHPGSNGAARLVEEFAYDLAGRPLLSRQYPGSGANPIDTCLTLDVRGRPTQKTTPGIDTVNIDYMYLNNATSIVSKAAGIIDSYQASDWMGRSTYYSDKWDTANSYSYAPAGQTSEANYATNRGAGQYKQTWGYLGDGRLSTVSYTPNGGVARTLATVGYQGDGDLDAVTYGNGTKLTVTYDALDRQNKKTYTTAANSLIASDEATYSQSNRIVDQKVDGNDANTIGNNFQYDGAGRLLKAFAAPGNTFDYEFSSTPSCGAAGAGRNSNRTRVLFNGSARDTFCTNDQDQTYSATGGSQPFTYDSYGRMTSGLGSTYGYDNANRHVSTISTITAPPPPPGPTTTTTVAGPTTTVAGATTTTVPSGGAGVSVFGEGFVGGWSVTGSYQVASGGNPGIMLSRPSTPAYEGVGGGRSSPPVGAFTTLSFDVKSSVPVALGIYAPVGGTQPLVRQVPASVSWTRFTCSFPAWQVSWAWMNFSLYAVGAAGSVSVDNIETGYGTQAVDTCQAGGPTGGGSGPTTTVAGPTTTVAGPTTTTIAAASGTAVFGEGFVGGWSTSSSYQVASGGNPGVMLSRPSTPAYEGVGGGRSSPPVGAFTTLSFDVKSSVPVALGIYAPVGGTQPLVRQVPASVSWTRYTCSFPAWQVSWAWMNFSLYAVGAAGSVSIDNIETGYGTQAVDTCQAGGPGGGGPPTTTTTVAGPTTTVAGPTTTVAGPTTTVPVVPSTVSTTFSYDSGDRRVKRVSTGDTTTYYSFSGGGDSPSVTMTGGPGAFVVSDYLIGLPGGVTFNRQMVPSLNVRWSLSSIHGDLLAVVSDVGVKQGFTYRWDPDGMPIAGTAQPDLTTGKFENGWLGQHQRMTDTTDSSNPIVEMGARVYLPRIDRFTSPDPVEGGVGDSDYLYPPDPVNRFDLTGRSVTGFCVTTGLFIFFGLSGTSCSVEDEHGNLADIFVLGGGAGLDAGLGAGAFYSNADTLFELSGWSTCGSGSAFGGTVEGCGFGTVTDPLFSIFGGGAVGVPAGFRVGGHAVVAYTWVRLLVAVDVPTTTDVPRRRSVTPVTTVGFVFEDWF